jgi:hydroxyacylglutathione hydrolase
MNLDGGDAWTDLGDGILVRQSKAFAMNSVVLANAEHTILVDPGILPSEMDDLAGLVREAEPKETTLFFTHAHWDHVLGRPWWPKARTLAHDRFAAEVRAERASILTDIENLAQEHDETWAQGFEPFAPDLAVSGLKFLPLGPWRLVLRDAPGHSSSQLSCHLADHSLLLAADMLSDIEPPILDGPCAPYRATLEALQLLAQNGAIDTVIPGHGSIARGRDAVLARFRTDLGYLDALERGVREAKTKGQSLEAAQQALAAMDYTARDSAPEWVGPFHKENIGFAYEGVNQPRR